MKKRSNLRSNLTGRSFSDGIELSKNGKYSLVVVTTEGKIIRKPYKRNEKDLPKENGKEGIGNIFILLLLIIPIYKIDKIADIMIYTAVAMFLEMMSLGLTISKEAKEYHAAEHMVINAFEKYERIPTIEELRESSPYSPTCGSSSVMFCSIAILLIGLYCKYSSTRMLYIISCGMIINIILYLSYSYKYIQAFVIKKPTESKLNVALQALEELVKQLK